MFKSMRMQLTLWYTAVLAVVLMVFSLVTYSYLAGLTRARSDRSLADTAKLFAANFGPELKDHDQSGESVAVEIAREFRFTNRGVAIYDRANQAVATSDFPAAGLAGLALEGTDDAIRNLLGSATRDGEAYATLRAGGRRVRAFAIPVYGGGQEFVVMVAESLYEQEEALEQARHAFYVAIPLALGIAAFGGYFLARRSLSPVVAMGERASQIGSDNLHERLPVSNASEELGRLAFIFNDLLSRLENAFVQQRRFMADASHELRTPIAIVRGESEVALAQENRSAGEYRESLAVVHDEGKRLTRIVDDLFILARADAGQYPLQLADFYLDEAVSDCARAMRSLASTNGLDLSYQIRTGEALFRGDEALIRRMIINLVDNAVKYTPRDGRVSLTLTSGRDEFVITVMDSGRGIPPGASPHIFERFFRGDKAHTSIAAENGSGAGLGLSIARWIAEMHGGTLTLSETGPSGSVFVVSLPHQ